MNDLDRAIDMLEKIKSPEVFNPVALTIHQQIKRRIYTEGKNAKGAKIGNYAPSTLKTRNNPKNRGRVPQSRNIILQFSGQMVRDFTPIKQGDFILGSGFKNTVNNRKARWIERQQTQKIFEMTTAEERLFENLLQKQVDRLS